MACWNSARLGVSEEANEAVALYTRAPSRFGSAAMSPVTAPAVRPNTGR